MGACQQERLSQVDVVPVLFFFPPGQERRAPSVCVNSYHVDGMCVCHLDEGVWYQVCVFAILTIG